MGDPKKKHKSYTTPRVPYNTEMFVEDLKLLGAYGLRNKRELWRIRTLLSHHRRRARSLLAMIGGERELLEKQLIGKISKMGLIAPNGSLDDILTMSVEDFMERRLQTFILKEWRRAYGKLANSSLMDTLQSTVARLPPPVTM
jgi:small subunit ribosomal protein S4